MFQFKNGILVNLKKRIRSGNPENWKKWSGNSENWKKLPENPKNWQLCQTGDISDTFVLIEIRFFKYDLATLKIEKWTGNPENWQPCQADDIFFYWN